MLQGRKAWDGQKDMNELVVFKKIKPKYSVQIDQGKHISCLCGTPIQRMYMWIWSTAVHFRLSGKLVMQKPPQQWSLHRAEGLCAKTGLLYCISTSCTHLLSANVSFSREQILDGKTSAGLLAAFPKGCSICLPSCWTITQYLLTSTYPLLLFPTVKSSFITSCFRVTAL